MGSLEGDSQQGGSLCDRWDKVCQRYCEGPVDIVTAETYLAVVGIPVVVGSLGVGNPAVVGSRYRYGYQCNLRASIIRVGSPAGGG